VHTLKDGHGPRRPNGRTAVVDGITPREGRHDQGGTEHGTEGRSTSWHVGIDHPAPVLGADVPVRVGPTEDAPAAFGQRLPQGPGSDRSSMSRAPIATLVVDVPRESIV